MKIKYNKDEYRNFYMEKDINLITDTMSNYKNVFLVIIILSIVNFFILYLFKLSSIYYISYVILIAVFIILLFSLFKYYKKNEKFKISLIFFIVLLLLIILNLMFFGILGIAMLYVKNRVLSESIFLEILLRTSIAYLIVLCSSLYHHNKYIQVVSTSPKKVPVAIVTLFTYFLFKYFYEYKGIMALVIFIASCLPLFAYSIGFIRCKRLFAFEKSKVNN